MSEKITSIINLKIFELKERLSEFPGKKNTTSGRIIKGKIRVLDEILIEGKKC